MNYILDQIDQGVRPVVYATEAGWSVDEKAKEAILTMFSDFPIQEIQPKGWDRIPLKIQTDTSVRVVPGSIIRYTAYMEPYVVIMPSFINVGAYIGTRTMIDSMTTVGSCVRVGKNCHIAANVVLAGVLEPVQERPVVIEDDCFIGAQSVIAEGVLVRKGAVVGTGVRLTQSTRIIDRETGTTYYGEVPEGAVVVPGSYKTTESLSIDCAIIVRYRAEGIPIRELLRGAL